MWNRPKFIEEPIIDASRVAHPLLQMSTEKFVTNPVSSGCNYSRIKVLTGPNACGKSVYLKQVGLLVYLAHIGSFVPAEVAHMGTVNRIMSRIYTTDSVLDGMSTFAKDLDQISVSLRRGNERSLIIIDEFGKGTLTEVGLSLLASSLSYWAAKGQSGCPHVFIASHFHALSKLISDHCDILSYHVSSSFENVEHTQSLEFFRQWKSYVEEPNLTFSSDLLKEWLIQRLRHMWQQKWVCQLTL
ncbi:unnamed protein product [Angiostrongylus costaricensis]|uniref:DNA_MISMATCH_REPAIR_2 domain-containing protein n=1 Tax=Angiostrongylus costaricensis TaxID=334426 RepID=A0A0R3PN73_ANGCS|nr:unnamed protein product [Angiostrongylus costaricensis]